MKDDEKPARVLRPGCRLIGGSLGPGLRATNFFKRKVRKMGHCFPFSVIDVNGRQQPKRSEFAPSIRRLFVETPDNRNDSHIRRIFGGPYIWVRKGTCVL